MNSGFASAHDDFSRGILTISQLNRAVAGLLERNIPLVWVRGEVSNFTAAASGHWYFTLKDGGAAARGVMFRGRAMLVGFTPREGDRIEGRARVSLYEPRGDYQLQVEAMRRAGQGDLFEAFLRLKEKLSAEGLFDPARKRTPVAVPRALGIVTSLQAAALRDVLTALARRVPHARVVIYPAPVQGDEAGSRLAQAIALANKRAEVDTLLLVRGGGSIEDLWAFNHEGLARAIVASAIPVISGVGLETDFTIADFAADLRAPTPTAAAELAGLPREQWLARLRQAAQDLRRAQRRRVEQAGQRLDRAAAQLISPRERLARQQERLAALVRSLDAAWSGTQRDREAEVGLLRQRLIAQLPDPTRLSARVDDLARRVRQCQAYQLARLQQRLASHAAHLRALGPEQTLARGYAIVRDEQGGIVRQARSLQAGARLDLSFAEGAAQASVTAVEADRGLV